MNPENVIDAEFVDLHPAVPEAQAVSLPEAIRGMLQGIGERLLAETEAEATEANRLAQEFHDGIQGLAIDSDAEFVSVGELVKENKGVLKAWEEKRVRVTGPLNGILDWVNALFKTSREMRKSDGVKLDGLIGEYIYRKEEKRKRDEADERRRVEAENRKLREEADKRAEKLEAKGLPEAAAEIRQVAEASQAPPPVFTAAATPKVAGLGSRPNWRWRCSVAGCGRQDCEHLIDRLPNEYLSVNIVAVNAHVKGVHDRGLLATEKIIEVYNTSSSVVRGKAGACDL